MSGKIKARIEALERLVAFHEEQLRRICTCPHGSAGNREADDPRCPIHASPVGPVVYRIGDPYPIGSGSSTGMAYCEACFGWHVPGVCAMPNTWVIS